jgi:hypothetical protein
MGLYLQESECETGIGSIYPILVPSCHSPLTFKSLKTKAGCSFERSVTDYPVMRYHTPDNLTINMASSLQNNSQNVSALTKTELYASFFHAIDGFTLKVIFLNVKSNPVITISVYETPLI